MMAHEAVDLVQRKFVRKPPTNPKLSTFTYQVLTSSHSNLTKGCIAALMDDSPYTLQWSASYPFPIPVGASGPHVIRGS